MHKNTIIFYNQPLHQTRIGRAVIGAATALLTAGSAYWAFMPEQESKSLKAPTVARAITPAQVSPFAPVVAAPAAPAVAMPQVRAAAIEPEAPRYDVIAVPPLVAPSPIMSQPFITLYPDVQSALRQLQRDDLVCMVQRYTHTPNSDGLVTTVPSPIGIINPENVVEGCTSNKLVTAFGNAADATFMRRMNELPNLLNAEDIIFPPVLIQVTAIRRGSDNFAPVASHTLVCQQEGSLRRDDVRFKCHLGIS